VEVGAEVEVMWRPSWLELASEGAGEVCGVVEEVVYLGDQQEVRVRVGEAVVKALVGAEVPVARGETTWWRGREARLFGV
jgi:ABC-type Fe3+/spermidine/putrescine transport system ATPase subunit